MDADAIRMLVAIQQNWQSEVALFLYLGEFKNTTCYVKLITDSSQLLTGNRLYASYRWIIKPVKLEMNNISYHFYADEINVSRNIKLVKKGRLLWLM